MRLPFTIEQFLDVFRRYNTAVWPLQWVLVSLALVAIALALRDRSTGNRAVSASLAALWLWMTLAYHLTFFASVNGAAVGFAVLFAAEAALFAWLAVRSPPMSYRPRSRRDGIVGGLVLAYALVIYPALGLLVGHAYPESPTFGVPCPTTIFTLGLAVWAPRFPWPVLIIPVAWAVVGTSAALNLAMPEDFGLVAAAIVSVASLIGHRRRATAAPMPA
jgi:hypothetical protein